MVFFVITGLSGAGKTSLVDEIVSKHGENLDLKKIVSYTTRSPRPGEVYGKDYFFIGEKEFDDLVKQEFFIETSCYNNAFYGAPRISQNLLEKTQNLIIVVDTKGALSLKNAYPEVAKLIFIGAPSLEEAERRLLSRGLDSDQAIEFRNKQNLSDLSYFVKHQDQFSLAVNNEEFGQTLGILVDFIKNNIFLDN